MLRASHPTGVIPACAGPTFIARDGAVLNEFIPVVALVDGTSLAYADNFAVTEIVLLELGAVRRDRRGAQATRNGVAAPT